MYIKSPYSKLNWYYGILIIGVGKMSDFEDVDFIDEVKEEIEEELKEPDMYNVVLHNDHYTTMEFVVEVIMKVFHKEFIEASKIMLDVHKKGKGIIGVYTYDIASTKVSQVRQMAKSRGFPLKCTMEKA
jgi:ATP-dependent Clp protease adaptor protein ClpS